MTQVRHPLLSLALICALATTSACKQEPQAAASSGDALPILDFGHAQVEIELAIDQSTQAKGLMYRQSMPEDHGMLFIFDQTKQMSFWMRNTHIPLDIGFLTADGVLREVYPLYPHDETSRKSIRSDLLYALEVNQGWFARHGVKPGDSFDPAQLP